MKKAVILAVLGAASVAMSSYGQGSLVFNSYLAGSYGATLITFGSNTGVLAGTKVGAGYSADVLWSLTPISDVAGSGALNPAFSTSTTSPSANNMLTAFNTGANAGYFAPAANFTLNPYTAGTTVYFEVIAFQTGFTYANSPIRAHSDSFSTTLATGQTLPGAATYGSFQLASVVPEPATMALAGLGGLASLVMLRRKKA
jgi:hypothetical protein